MKTGASHADRNADVFDSGTLPALLAGRARRASDRRLVVDAMLGMLLGIALVIFRPPLWLPLAALSGTLAAFGTWGILDRELLAIEAEAQHSRRSLRLGRTLVAAIGALLAVGGGLTLFFALLGSSWKL